MTISSFSYIIIGMADIPGAALAILLLDRIGRRLTIGGATVIYAVMLAALALLSVDQGPGQLALFVVAKAAKTTAMIGTGTYTTEFWPTAVRNTAFNVYGTAGRLGSIIASRVGAVGRVLCAFSGDFVRLGSGDWHSCTLYFPARNGELQEIAGHNRRSAGCWAGTLKRPTTCE